MADTRIGKYRVTKQFYADGPSMFEWVAESDDGDYRSFPTKREAVAYAQAQKDNTDG